MESLAHAVPMLVIPIDYDQPIAARHVHEAGLGIALDRDDASYERCASALERLLGAAAPHRARCREAAATLARRDGGQRAADLLLATFSR